KKKDGSSYDSSIAPEINLGNGTVKASASHTWASNLTVTLTADKVPTFDIDANKTITIASVVKGSGGLKKIGAGALTLSGANSYSGGTTVSAGKLILTDDALENAQGNFTVDENGTLEFYVAEGTKELSLSAQKELFITGKVIKTGAGELKIDSADPGSIDAHSFVVSSGRLDMKEYFKGSLAVGEQLAPENYLTAIFSPGNSVGALTIDGSGLQDGEYAFTLNPESTLLMEIGGQNTGANDILIVDGDILLGNDSIIRLAMTGDCPLELGESFTAILSAENSEGLDVLGHIQTSDFTELKYETVDYGGNTVYAITGRRFNANEIPEPSTWALLLLGAAGLLYVRKRKN
ncbi:MAG: autotransporter-associated beta strand repeat-containing protein, partial [Thermoguttaceae bacterium]|nr:autotransporter-associated beta strand repeat-containing protein [Thermoguttaceae bacterium]